MIRWTGTVAPLGVVSLDGNRMLDPDGTFTVREGCPVWIGAAPNVLVVGQAFEVHVEDRKRLVMSGRLFDGLDPTIRTSLGQLLPEIDFGRFEIATPFRDDGVLVFTQAEIVGVILGDNTAFGGTSLLIHETPA